jgi:hypothetical protein
MVAKGVFPEIQGASRGNTELRWRKMDFGLFGSTRPSAGEKRPAGAFFWEIVQLF